MGIISDVRGQLSFIDLKREPFRLIKTAGMIEEKSIRAMSYHPSTQFLFACGMNSGNIHFYELGQVSNPVKNLNKVFRKGR